MADKKKYRRSNGEGSVFRHNNGKWCGQIALGVDENGKRTRKTVYGVTRAEGVEKLAVLRGSIDAHKLKPSLRTTVGQFREVAEGLQEAHGDPEDVRVVHGRE